MGTISIFSIIRFMIVTNTTPISSHIHFGGKISSFACLDLGAISMWAVEVRILEWSVE